MPKKPPNAGKGRKRGSTNRATADARAAIAEFVDGNAHRLQEWLDAVAKGLKTKGKKGKPSVWIIPPNPERAFAMFQGVIEYHIPKLSRQEVVREDKGSGRILDSSQLTAEQREQLRLMLAQSDPALLEQQAPEPVGLAVAQVVDSTGDEPV